MTPLEWITLAYDHLVREYKDKRQNVKIGTSKDYQEYIWVLRGKTQYLELRKQPFSNWIQSVKLVIQMNNR